MGTSLTINPIFTRFPPVSYLYCFESPEQREITPKDTKNVKMMTQLGLLPRPAPAL